MAGLLDENHEGQKAAMNDTFIYSYIFFLERAVVHVDFLGI